MNLALLAESATPAFGANDRGIILFGFEIYYYAICIVSGIIAATVLSALLMKRRNMSPDTVFVGFLIVIPVALIFTRLFYCITKPLNIREWFAWSSLREGGLSITGGLIGGVLATLVFCLVKKIDFLRAADCVVPTILLAQAMGRWGNYFNGEVYGGVVGNPSLQWFPFAVFENGAWHYAFFFYESVINLIGFALLFSAAWFRKRKPNGLILCAYFVWYGTVRTVMEPLRDPSFILQGGGVPWSLVFSILMIVGGLAGAGLLLFFNYRREGALIGSKEGDPYGISRYLTPYKDETPYFSKINLFGAGYPPMPEEQTSRYKWNKFCAKVKAWFGKDKPEENEETTAPENNEQPENEQTTEPEENGQTESGQEPAPEEDQEKK